MIRAVLYLDQFFGGIGGEDKADLPRRVTEELVGLAKAFVASLADRGRVVATVICGHNYFAENIKTAGRVVKRARSAFSARSSSGPECDHRLLRHLHSKCRSFLELAGVTITEMIALPRSTTSSGG